MPGSRDDSFDSCDGADGECESRWQRDGGIACSRVVVSRRGGSNNCIVQSGVTIFALYGQTWQYNSRKRDGKGERSPSCKASVEPDLVEIDGQYFSLNETVPDAQKDDLYALFLNGTALADVPKELQAFETNYYAGEA